MHLFFDTTQFANSHCALGFINLLYALYKIDILFQFMHDCSSDCTYALTLVRYVVEIMDSMYIIVVVVSH